MAMPFPDLRVYLYGTYIGPKVDRGAPFRPGYIPYWYIDPLGFGISGLRVGFGSGRVCIVGASGLETRFCGHCAAARIKNCSFGVENDLGIWTMRLNL